MILNYGWLLLGIGLDSLVFSMCGKSSPVEAVSINRCISHKSVVNTVIYRLQILSRELQLKNKGAIRKLLNRVKKIETVLRLGFPSGVLYFNFGYDNR